MAVSHRRRAARCRASLQDGFESRARDGRLVKPGALVRQRGERQAGGAGEACLLFGLDLDRAARQLGEQRAESVAPREPAAGSQDLDAHSRLAHRFDVVRHPLRHAHQRRRHQVLAAGRELEVLDAGPRPRPPPRRAQSDEGRHHQRQGLRRERARRELVELDATQAADPVRARCPRSAPCPRFESAVPRRPRRARRSADPGGEAPPGRSRRARRPRSRNAPPPRPAASRRGRAAPPADRPPGRRPARRAIRPACRQMA